MSWIGVFIILDAILTFQKLGVARITQKDQLAWPQLIDENTIDGALIKHYGIEAVSSNLLLYQNRKIIGVDLSVQEMEDLIGRLQG